MKWLIGVDEAGRGPLAGPVAVCAVIVEPNFDWARLPGLTDSKQLSALKRDRLFVEAKKLRDTRSIDYSVTLVGPARIDRDGIVRAVSAGLSTTLSRLRVDPLTCEIRLDGLLTAGPRFIHQSTIIKGDVTEPVISLASIVAKVTRDRYMERLAAAYPQYGFSAHKGYGTKAHRRSIQVHGVSNVHRQTYCHRLTDMS